MNRDPLVEVYRHPLLQASDLDQLISVHRPISFEKGDFILKEGALSNAYYILVTGLVRSFVFDFDQNDITTNFISKNELILEASSLFQGIPSQENFQALTPCHCLKIDFEDFQRLFHSIKGFREWGRAWMAESLFQLKKRSLSMITDSATDRYLNLLSQQSDILKNAPLKDVASYLGITDSSLSRIRKETARN
ncbi:MAG: Crp/Fnr family transcriptional regulator [Maribacter sp.]|uniref:Crp/Fnr family transcriptional regulator n=1 Tax=Maribacter sp. 2307UL18-2 TaxID=3386274 RepID=UPI0039BD1E89